MLNMIMIDPDNCRPPWDIYCPVLCKFIDYDEKNWSKSNTMHHSSFHCCVRDIFLFHTGTVEILIAKQNNNIFV
jgi:hypothetical protein